jgi:hypothetical protein
MIINGLHGLYERRIICGAGSRIDQEADCGCDNDND